MTAAVGDLAFVAALLDTTISLPPLALWLSGREDVLEAWCLQVVEVDDGQVVHVHHILGPELFLRLGLPVRLDA